MIKNIEIGKITPHPNNPRKDLGDLTELTESIKTNGIFQNLTVVPYYSQIKNRVIEGTYTVIIGHRRLAAAKLAGLTEVPCAVVEMSEKEQLATMLLENMQRSDLTIYEQAKGFQMMLDLGEDEESIAKKTGFSKSTVHRRVSLLELDEELFKTGQERGATLADYAMLEKIKDIELKNKALKAIGTGNFDYEVRACIEEEKKNAARAEWDKILSAFAIKLETALSFKDYNYEYFNIYSFDKFQVPEDAKEKQYYYSMNPNDNWVYLYYEREKEEETEDENTEGREQKLRVEKLKEVAIQCSQIRADFIKKYCEPSSQSEKLQLLVKALEGYLLLTNNPNFFMQHIKDIEDCKKMFSFLSCDVPEEENIKDFANFGDLFKSNIALKESVARHPIRFILAILYLRIEKTYYDTENYLNTWNWNGKYNGVNASIDIYLHIFESLGYQFSDVEISLFDGTSELYYREETEDDK